MKCERCKNEKGQIKAGETKAGSQKYKCKICGKIYMPKPKERNYSEEVIEMDKLYSFVKRKNRVYVITPVSREKRKILGHSPIPNILFN